MSDRLSMICNISVPTNYMLIQGTDDTVLPYKGLLHHNFGLISAPDAMALIAQQNIENPIVS